MEGPDAWPANRDVMIAGVCHVCRWACLTINGLCVDCREIREWARVNRAFCHLIHRQHLTNVEPTN
ncbi:MAG TPA: hypothetical protein VIV12_25645 [Streptosporangiaceae bacterium]